VVAPAAAIELSLEPAQFCQAPAAWGKHLQALRSQPAAYQSALQQWQQALKTCREQSAFPVQAVWLRLHACDGPHMPEIFDRIQMRGYNRVYLETLYDGRILLPAAANSTPWQSVANLQGQEKQDLLAEAIAAGRARGMQVYAWKHALNVGYAYGVRPDREPVLARNGQGKTSLDLLPDPNTPTGEVQAFADPNHPQIREDLQQAIAATLQRQPDGVLLDYIRYVRQTGGASIATTVRDLWIYGEASRTAFLAAVPTPQREVRERFLTQGFVTATDIAPLLPPSPAATNANAPRTKSNQLAVRPRPPAAELARQQALWQDRLWQESIDFAQTAIVDFLTVVGNPVTQAGLPVGAVFFPGGNQAIGRGFDSRLQPWHRFDRQWQWHPMSYARCGTADCIVEEVARVMAEADGVEVAPVLTGQWGQAFDGRPALEDQMRAIAQRFPQIRSVSHFAFAWQEPAWDRARQTCTLPRP
jgi:hypothetical protein